MVAKFALKTVSATGEVQGGRQVNRERTRGVLVPYLRVANVFDGYIDFSDVNTMAFSHEELERFRLIKGDILLNEGQSIELVGRAALYEGGPRYCCYQNTLIRYRAGPDVDPNFAIQLFRYCQKNGVFARAAVRTNSIAHLGVSRFAELKLPFPRFLSEQSKIAEILKTWDEALEKLAALRSTKEKRLNSLRAELLFGGRRLDGQQRRWKSTRLASVTHELTNRNGTEGLSREYVMGVSKAQGIVPMREQTISGDISRYKRLPPRAFAYNPMRINVGSIAMNNREEEVLVSPDYVIFACNPDGLYPDYLDHLRKTRWWAHYINSGGSGSVRQRTYYDDLAALKPPLPDVDEQQDILAVLNTARDDLAATEREVEALIRQKRGLMQKLLTGKWRVNIEEMSA
ncbi:restriction endonuclease subunit S [Salinisphaera hydrothermalis]|uniref:restriction endonuclease subunit S n=1 Tax=Salinisphaera hydrothermalis TaxID=563188 RepID=UPI00333FC6BC